MSTPAALLALASVVEGGIGPDREIDALVWVALHEGLSVVKAWYGPAYVKGPDESTNVPEPLTANSDVALALLADRLPGYGIALNVGAVGPRGKAKGAEWSGMAHARIYGWAPECSVTAEAVSVPRAIVAAVCRAVAGREQG